MASYSHGDASQGWSASALGYHGTWNATNQIPDWPSTEGLVGRFGSLSPTDGGLTDRYLLSGEFIRPMNIRLPKSWRMLITTTWASGITSISTFPNCPHTRPFGKIWGPVRATGHPVGAGVEGKSDVLWPIVRHANGKHLRTRLSKRRDP